MKRTTKKTDRKPCFDETLLDRIVFATWSDIAPSLLFIGDTAEEALAFMKGQISRGHSGDIPVATLRDVLEAPERNGVGGPIGGYET